MINIVTTILVQAQCNFIPLRNLLLVTHMQDLKDTTNNTHNCRYRKKKLRYSKEEMGILVRDKPEERLRRKVEG